MNYYKIKKSYGSDKNKDFDEYVFKKMGDLQHFEKMDLGIYIQGLRSSIKDLNETIGLDLNLANA